MYVANSLNLAPQGKHIPQKYTNLINAGKKKKQSKDNLTGDEIAMDVIKRVGLKFKEAKNHD